MSKVVLVKADKQSPEEGFAKALVVFEPDTESQGFTWQRWTKTKGISGLKNGVEISTGEIYLFIEVGKLVRIEEKNGVSELVFSDDRKMSTLKSLDFFEKGLAGYKFYRIHPNHLINIRFLQSMVKCDAYVVLTNSEMLPAKFLDDRMALFLESNDIL